MKLLLSSISPSSSAKLRSIRYFLPMWKSSASTMLGITIGNSPFSERSNILAAFRITGEVPPEGMGIGEIHAA